ncbi:UNVERIFIED_CONTAM: hypothetical protein RMT77_009402 [Armadillidium vulgare]
MIILKQIFVFTLVVLSQSQTYDGDVDPNSIDSASLPVEHRSAGFGPDLGSEHALHGQASDPWPLVTNRDMPSIKNIQVQCENTFMRVAVEFDRPFYGMIFSKGYYSDPSCVHLPPESGHLQVQFDIYLNSCGMSSSGGDNYGQPSHGGTFIENTIIIQYDPLVQEVWDAARKLRCTWYDYYEKSVTFKPFQVDMLNAVTANFLGDNLQCWMQIQVGKGPWASEVSGIVKIGQTMTMVLAIKDDENKFDMMVRNCVAHDGKRAPIQLVDQNGCITRPKIMGRFQKIKNFGSSASVVSYAYFQAFKFPDSMNVHFQCVIQVCRYQCPVPDCPEYGYGGGLPVGGGGGGYHGAGSETDEVKVPLGHNTLPDPRHAGRPTKQALTDGSINRQSETPYLEDEEPQPLPVPVSLKLKPDDLNIPKETVSRVGAVDSLLGRPRAIDIEKLDFSGELNKVEKPKRERRHVVRRETQEMKDISTERIIQVVAPGDLAFNLHAQNETVVIASSLGEGSHICMSTTGFAAGLIMLLLVLTIACLVACFLYTRVRTFNSKGSVTTFVQGYDNPEFVKVPSTN